MNENGQMPTQLEAPESRQIPIDRLFTRLGQLTFENDLLREDNVRLTGELNMARIQLAMASGETEVVDERDA